MGIKHLLAALIALAPVAALAGQSNPPGIPYSYIGAPSGVAGTDGNGLVPQQQIPPTTTAQSYAPYPAGALNSYTSGLYALYSTMPVLSSYTGALYTVRRESDGATLNVSAVGSGNTSAAIALWANGSDVYVTALYDQSGNVTTPITIGTASQQPKLNVSAAYPSFEFDGQNSQIAAQPLVNWLTGASGAHVFALRKYDNANTSYASRPIIYASTGTSQQSRLTMGIDNTIGSDLVSGRTLDTDGLNRSGGFAPNTSWDVESGRFNYSTLTVQHLTNVAGETRAFNTAAAVSNTASQFVNIGTIYGSTSFMEGKVAVLALYTGTMSDQTAIGITGALSGLVSDVQGPTPILDWGPTALAGPFTLATGLTNYTVDQPDGTTPPVYTDIESLWYHHHTRVAVFGGRVWVAYSGAAENEQQGGQITEINSATAPWTTPYGPQVVVPPQSLPFQITGSGNVPGTRISYPWAFVTYGGSLYLVSAVDQINNKGTAQDLQQGEALIAVLCNSNGTIGTPFLISPTPYTVLSGVTAYSYSAALSPALYAAALQYGTWGGSAPGQPSSLWSSINGYYYEPNTITLNSGSQNLLRLWRKNFGNMDAWLYTQLSSNGGRTWGPFTRTDIPSAVTETALLQLPSAQDNDIVIVGNPPSGTSGDTTARDPLYIATFGGTTGQLCGVFAVRQNMPNTPTYPNSQIGGAQYPGVASDGTTLYITYSITKQNIGLTTIPIANLSVCN